MAQIIKENLDHIKYFYFRWKILSKLLKEGKCHVFSWLFFQLVDNENLTPGLLWLLYSFPGFSDSSFDNWYWNKIWQDDWHPNHYFSGIFISVFSSAETHQAQQKRDFKGARLRLERARLRTCWQNVDY